MGARCEAAQVGPLVHALPDGLDTVVGDRGYRLSGGEKQRMAIARLLLKAPGVVVLDEATAHLDSESEAAVQEALRTALAGRTSIVIAHRLSTVREADQILVLEAGRVAEHGRHDELLAARRALRRALPHAVRAAGRRPRPRSRGRRLAGAAGGALGAAEAAQRPVLVVRLRVGRLAEVLVALHVEVGRADVGARAEVAGAVSSCSLMRPAYPVRRSTALAGPRRRPGPSRR